MNFPGTTIEKTKSDGKTFLGGMFIGTGGLVMKQICALTGLNTPAIQNWVNRGWISHPVGKTYNKDQVARIFISQLWYALQKKLWQFNSLFTNEWFAFSVPLHRIPMGRRLHR